MKRKFRIIMLDGRVSYAVAENSRVVRRRIEKSEGKHAAKTACINAFADVPPANSNITVGGKRGIRVPS